MPKKTIDEDKLIKEVEVELESLKDMTEEEMAAEAQKYLSKPKSTYQKMPDPYKKEQQREREKFKRAQITAAREKMKKLGLVFDEHGNIVKKEE